MYILKIKEIAIFKGSVHGRTLRFSFKDREDLKQQFKRHYTGLRGVLFILNNLDKFSEEEYIRFVKPSRGELNKFYVYTLEKQAFRVCSH